MAETNPDQGKWDARYRDAAQPSPPARVVTDYGHLLPTAGAALDLACGLGGNALYLAARGLSTHAWDLSPVAIERLRASADKQGLPVMGEVRDVLRDPPESARFDVICVTRFLERGLCPFLTAALKPGGLLYYQTFTRIRRDESGPRNDAYRLGRNELLALFPALEVVAYREEGAFGDIRLGWRNEAMLVGARRQGQVTRRDGLAGN